MTCPGLFNALYMNLYEARRSRPPRAFRYRVSAMLVTVLARRMLLVKLRMRAMMPGFLRTRLASSAMVASRV